MRAPPLRTGSACVRHVHARSWDGDILLEYPMLYDAAVLLSGSPYSNDGLASLQLYYLGHGTAYCAINLQHQALLNCEAQPASHHIVESTEREKYVACMDLR